MEEKSEKEKRVRAITRLYYSNPKVQEAIVNFAKDREVVPRYFEGFGKRPDMINYPSDVLGSVNRGATSFHASEELWNDALHLSSEISSQEMDELRKGWDLLIDIDTPFLDCSKIAAKMIIAAFEHHGIKNYGIKFSGSKGFHIIISGNAFPREYDGMEMKKMFPEWPRAITEYLMYLIKPDYNKEVGRILSEKDIAKRTNITEEELQKIYCMQCGNTAKKGAIAKFFCPVCSLTMEKKDFKMTKRRLKCLNDRCAGVLEVTDSSEYYYCEYCKDPENKKMQLTSAQHPNLFEKVKGVSTEDFAKLDLVLVAPRHLFRMPYSLHEKTSLASIVIKKEQLDNFSPKDAEPLKVQIYDFLPHNDKNEGKKLLVAALDWKKNQNLMEKKFEKKKYAEYEKIDVANVSENIFPAPIKKLLKGLKDGKKRGLFILITFLKCLNFPADYINSKIREWNKLNEPPLKEGYIKSQIDWHLRQKRKILPPNYENQSFYRDLGLIDNKPDAKNPIVEVLREIRKK